MVNPVKYYENALNEYGWLSKHFLVHNKIMKYYDILL